MEGARAVGLAGEKEGEFGAARLLGGIFQAQRIGAVGALAACLGTQARNEQEYDAFHDGFGLCGCAQHGFIVVDGVDCAPMLLILAMGSHARAMHQQWMLLLVCGDVLELYSLSCFQRVA